MQALKEQSAEPALLPCPFCGSNNLRIDELMFSGDDGEHPGVECLNCDASNRVEFWNKRINWRNEPTDEEIEAKRMRLDEPT
ncbi:MAG: hypothetical protein AB2604_10775 [Candidatus Thiodiazotropha taylori]